jgi:hypothetical protein
MTSISPRFLQDPGSDLGDWAGCHGHGCPLDTCGTYSATDDKVLRSRATQSPAPSLSDSFS